MNKNTKRKVEARRDAYGRVKMLGSKAGPADLELAAQVGRKPRRYRFPKVGASGKDIARRLGHDTNPDPIILR